MTCPSYLVERSHGGGNDIVRCQLPEGHKVPHRWTGKNARKGETITWKEGDR